MESVLGAWWESGGLLHTAEQQWSSLSQGPVGVRCLPGPTGSCAWRNTWVCKEKIHGWLVQAESPPFPPWTVSQTCPVPCFALTCPSFPYSKSGRGAAGRYESHSCCVLWGIMTSWCMPWFSGETRAEPCPGPELLSFIRKRNTAAAALASSDWLNEFQGFYCL